MHKSSSLGGAVLSQDLASNSAFGGFGGRSPSDIPEVSLPVAVLCEQKLVGEHRSVDMQPLL